MPHDDVAAFPAQYARTRRFALGAPRQLAVAQDGSRVFFVRTASGSDPTSSLWVWEDGRERVLADPGRLVGAAGEVPTAERLRRERAREPSAGLVSYTVDHLGRTAAFALDGALWAVRVADPAPFPVATAGPVVDPRLSPDGRHVCYVTGGALHVVELAPQDPGGGGGGGGGGRAPPRPPRRAAGGGGGGGGRA
ncbi:hypothetical protein AAHZ94_33740, partial [Streptomyces sp. HSW2009]